MKWNEIYWTYKNIKKNSKKIFEWYMCGFCLRVCVCVCMCAFVIIVGKCDRIMESKERKKKFNSTIEWWQCL